MTTTPNIRHRQTIIVEASKKDSAGGLLNETEEREVIFLQHSKRMPGFMQCDSGGATVYLPVASFRRTVWSLEDFERDGAVCFALGKVRIVPQAFLVDSGVEAAEAWYRGWDRANLAAPVPGLDD